MCRGRCGQKRCVPSAVPRCASLMCPALPDGNDAGRKATREVTAISATQAHPASARHQLGWRATEQHPPWQLAAVAFQDESNQGRNSNTRRKASICLAIYLSISSTQLASLSLFHLITYLSIYLPTCLSISPFHLSICLAVYLSICVAVSFSVM